MQKIIDHFQKVYKNLPLIYGLTERHVASRYRGSVLGFLWSLINPLMLMGIYTLVFKYYIKFDSIPYYSVFMLTGLLPWIWITSSISEGATSITSSGHLVTKAMFPAQVLPLVVVLGSLVHFLLSILVLIVFSLCLGKAFTLSSIFLPIIVFFQFIFLYGISLVVSALNVRFRDIQHIIPNIFSLLFFLCPIVYTVNSVPERFRWTLTVNPFAFFIGIYHKVIFDGEFLSIYEGLILIIVSTISLYIGVSYFEKSKEGLAECL